MTAAALPLATSPVAIFLIVLLIILLAPILLNQLKIPHIIGMIVAGVIVGPHGFNILAADSSFDIFGQVGLLYLMFLAGLEIDMYHLRLNLRRGLLFGILTFTIPMVLGVLTSVYILGISWLTSCLLGAMYASHTLISYPVVTRIGITKSPAVLISIVGTIIAVIGALLVLAVAVNIHDTGSFEITGILQLVAKLAIYCAAVLYIYPRATRFFFKRTSDPVTQYVYILAAVFLSAYISGLIGLEPVLGSFFAGLVLNRFVPNSSTLMGRIEFVGNALFIPYFLIGVGMMIDIRVIAEASTLAVAAIMLTVALVSKWLAAYAAQRAYHMDSPSRGVIFGLTTAHTAVALAVVTVGYNMTGPDGAPLMDDTILNGTVLVILITCAIAPIATSRAAQRLRIRMLETTADDTERDPRRLPNTLIPLANPVTIPHLVDLAVIMRGQHRDTPVPSLFALHVRNDNSARSRAMGDNALDIARRTAASLSLSIEAIERYDINTVTGILNVIAERDIDNVIIGMHRRTTVIDSFLGSKIEQLLTATNRMVVISRCFIPINTIRRIVVYIPDKAQFESGFAAWLHAVANIARELGCRMIICCRHDQRLWTDSIVRRRPGVRLEYRDVVDPSDFIIISDRIADDDLFVVVSARPTSVSYSAEMVEIPGYLQKYCASDNILYIYPEQFGTTHLTETFADPLRSDINRTPSPWLLRAAALLRRLGLTRRHTRRSPDRLRL